MHHWAVLLRGINVGGKNLISMADLRAAFDWWGYADPVTYIQSGNVIVTARKAKTTRTASAIERRLAERFGYRARVVVRDRDEMAAIVRRIPRDWDVADTSIRRYICFLTDAIDGKAFARSVTLKPDFEALAAGPHALYWSAPMATLTRTTMVKLPSDAVYQEMTIRNHRTTLAIAELLRAR